MESRFSGSFQYGDTSKGGLIRNGKERIQIGVSLENIFRGFHRGLQFSFPILNRNHLDVIVQSFFKSVFTIHR